MGEFTASLGYDWNSIHEDNDLCIHEVFEFDKDALAASLGYDWNSIHEDNELCIHEVFEFDKDALARDSVFFCPGCLNNF
jgi:ADP-dependent phosphofructokinase/glucokinase